MGHHEARAKLQAAKALPASLGKPLFYPLPCPHSNEILAVFFFLIILHVKKISLGTKPEES